MPPPASPDLLNGIAALVGGAGVSGVLIAFFGYLTATRNGRRPEEKPVIALAGSQPPIMDQAAVGHLGTIAYGITRLVAIQELRAELDMKEPPGFRDRLDDKVDRLTIEAIKAWIKRG